jgi:hypothetical protein
VCSNSAHLIEKVIADASQSSLFVSQFNLSLQGAGTKSQRIQIWRLRSIRQIVDAMPNNVNDQILSVSSATEQQAIVAASTTWLVYYETWASKAWTVRGKPISSSRQLLRGSR